ncbi:putative ORF6N domain protein [Candidatus Termititenax dinenymphae]|uniref:ORF6N domain protein n=1 Tax=Candidatus Termititenax dinenymphae TaxID=2218523 RepID=A0A388TLE0_9BACT|nr:putative ORF6N domain protein [Candidatus Termititenax dinenymphae]
MTNNISIFARQYVEEKIIIIRGQRVILDSSVAELYGVETKRINEGVRNNPDKFLDDYIFSLDAKEWINLKSKISSSSWGGKNKLPKAFTEKGLYMLATILKSPKATQATMAIVETFARMRELSRTISALPNVTDKAEQKSLMQKGGEILADILTDDLQVAGTETSIELNLAVLKIKHSVRQKRRRGE